MWEAGGRVPGALAPAGAAESSSVVASNHLPLLPAPESAVAVETGLVVLSRYLDVDRDLPSMMATFRSDQQEPL